MKRIHWMLLAGILSLGAGGAAADSFSLNSFKPKVMPVLVQVNSHGRVTEASPAYELPPRLDRLLRENLAEMISKPATDKGGKPIGSQFVMNLALQTTPRAEGDYDARFAYVSTSPVPAGSWYWVHIDGHRLALARRGAFQQMHRLPVERYSDSYRPVYDRGYQPTSLPTIRNVAPGATGTPTAPTPGR